MNTDSRIKNSFQVELLLVFIMLNSMGFPGTYTKIFGDAFGTVMEYAVFAMQIIAMMLSSGSSVLNVQLVNVNFQYVPLYQFMIVICAESMIGARDPKLQLITCVRLAVTILMAIWISEKFSIDRITELFCIAQVLFDCSVIVMMVVRPSLAFQDGDVYMHALRGVYSAKNALASELSLGTIMLFMLMRGKYQAKERGGGWTVVFVVHVVLLLMCQATGAILFALAVILYLLFFAKIRVPLAWVYIAVSVGFLFAALTILPVFAPLLEMIGKDATLTGRTELWNGIIQFMTDEKTFTGYGYGRFWMDRKAVARLHTYFDYRSYFSRMSTGAHNQILEMWLNTGMIGIGTFFAAVLGSFKNWHKMAASVYRFVSPLLLYLLLCGLTERVFENAYGYRLLLFFIIMAMGCGQNSQEKGENDNENKHAARYGDYAGV